MLDCVSKHNIRIGLSALLDHLLHKELCIENRIYPRDNARNAISAIKEAID